MNKTGVMLKKFMLYFFFLPSLVFAGDFYDIYNYKFPINDVIIENLQDNLVNVTIKKDPSEIIDKKDLDYHILFYLYNNSLKDNIYEICDINCNIDIFHKAFNKQQYKLSGLAFLLFLSNSKNDMSFLLKEDAFLSEKSKKEFIDFYKELFLIKIVLQSNVAKYLSKYFVSLAMEDSDWILNNALNFVLINEDNIADAFESLIKKEDASNVNIQHIKDVLNVEEKILGFSNKQYQKMRKDFAIFEKYFSDIDIAKNTSELIEISLPSESKESNFSEISQEVFVKKIYEIADNEMENKRFVEALNTLLLTPRNMISETAYEKLSFITDHAHRSDSLLNNERIEKLQKFFKDNEWLKKKFIKFEEKRIYYLADNKSNYDFELELTYILKLTSQNDFFNDKIKLKIAVSYLEKGDKEASDRILNSISNKSVYFSSFDGILLFCKKKLWIFFAILTFSFAICLIFYRLKASRNNVNSFEFNSSENFDFDDLSIDDKEDFEDNLQFFGLSPKNCNITKLKSIYRQKVKKIHPDIIGRESDEFLELQKRYKALIKKLTEKK